MANEGDLATPHLAQPVSSRSHVPSTLRVTDEQMWEKYRFSCTIDSVYYMPEVEKSEWVLENHLQAACAVLFTVNFNLGRKQLNRAVIPTLVAWGIDVPHHFPSRPETEVMPNSINTRGGWSLSPEIQASGTGGKLFERHREQEQIVPVTLELRVRKLNNVHGIGISWELVNQGSTYSPPSMSFLLVAATETRGVLPNFQFNLHILSELEVEIKSGWHRFRTVFQPRPNQWAFPIDSDYEPTKAKDAFCKCRQNVNKTERTVGLYPAVKEYLIQAQEVCNNRTRDTGSEGGSQQA